MSRSYKKNPTQQLVCFKPWAETAYYRRANRSTRRVARQDLSSAADYDDLVLVDRKWYADPWLSPSDGCRKVMRPYLDLRDGFYNDKHWGLSSWMKDVRGGLRDIKSVRMEYLKRYRHGLRK